MSKVRIARIRETGKAYILNSIDFNRGVAHLFGEVESHVGAKTTHSKGQVVPLEDVDVSTTEKTVELAAELFQQGIDSKIDSGDYEFIRVSGRKNKKVILRPTDPQSVEAQKELQKLAADLKGVLAEVNL